MRAFPSSAWGEARIPRGLHSCNSQPEVFIPSLAVGVRRLHDTGRSGWMLLIGLIPLVGWIVLLVFLCQDSAPGNNQYGPNPKLPGPVEALPAL